MSTMYNNHYYFSPEKYVIHKLTSEIMENKTRVPDDGIFCHEKIKFISSSRRVMFFLLYRQKDIDKIIEGNDRNYVIHKLTSEIMENKPLGSRM